MKSACSPLFLAILMALSSPICWAQSPSPSAVRSVTLRVSVTNSSLQEPREINVRFELPQELTLPDILSADGLKIEYDEGTRSLVARDKITLRPAETTFYNVVARDIWAISEDDVRAMRVDMNTLRFSLTDYPVQQQILELISELDLVLQEQSREFEDTSAYIQAARKNRKKLDEIRNNFETIRKLNEGKLPRPVSGPAAWRIDKAAAGVAVGLLFACILVVAGMRNKVRVRKVLRELPLRESLKVARLIPAQHISCDLLIDHEGAAAEKMRSFFFASPSRGRIALFLSSAYRAQSVVEVKVRLPQPMGVVNFCGTVVWQRKMFLADMPKEYYLTGISLTEISGEDLRKLKEHIEHPQGTSPKNG